MRGGLTNHNTAIYNNISDASQSEATARNDEFGRIITPKTSESQRQYIVANKCLIEKSRRLLANNETNGKLVGCRWQMAKKQD